LGLTQWQGATQTTVAQAMSWDGAGARKGAIGWFGAVAKRAAISGATGAEVAAAAAGVAFGWAWACEG
jgi:hypothetical protein